MKRFKHFLYLALLIPSAIFAQDFRINAVVGASYAKTNVTVPDYEKTVTAFAEETIPQALNWAEKRLLGKTAPEPELTLYQQEKTVGGIRPQVGVEAGFFDDYWNVRTAVLTTKYSSRWYLPSGVTFEASAGGAIFELLDNMFGYSGGSDLAEFVNESFFLNLQYNWDSGRNPVLDLGLDGTKTSNINLVFELRVPIDEVTISLFQAVSFNNGGHHSGLRLIYTKQ